jgi:DNA modification methylase
MAPTEPLSMLDLSHDALCRTELGRSYVTDALGLLKALPDDCLDLTVTSPPYERQPKYDNGERYERDWFQTTFLEITAELLRATKPTGQFVLNFRSRRQGSTRSVLQYELVFWLQEQGWLFAEDHVWVKPSPPPGRFKQATKDAIEYCFRFAKTTEYELHLDQCLAPARWDAKDRARRKKLAHNFERVNAPGGQGRKRVQAGPDWVAPTNALVVEPEFSPNPTKHPARFPPAIPEYFIKLCSKPGSLIYDPFAGTATTAVVAECLQRRWIVTELDESYAEVLPDRLDDLRKRLANAPQPVGVPEGVRAVPLPFALPAPKAVALPRRGKEGDDHGREAPGSQQISKVGDDRKRADARRG